MEWLYWLVAGGLLIALELLTVSFVVSYFGVGALAAAAAAGLGAPIEGQVLVFAAVSLTLQAGPHQIGDQQVCHRFPLGRLARSGVRLLLVKSKAGVPNKTPARQLRLPG